MPRWRLADDDDTLVIPSSDDDLEDEVSEMSDGLDIRLGYLLGLYTWKSCEVAAIPCSLG